MYYIKNAPETLPLPEIFENMCFSLPLRAPAPNSLGPDNSSLMFYLLRVDILSDLTGVSEILAQMIQFIS
jgi:hypothetical protein